MALQWANLPQFQDVIAAAALRVDRAAHTAVVELLSQTERGAKANASQGSHRKGTRTPATPGGGPAVISGTLRRSIHQTPVMTRGPGWYWGAVGPSVIYGRAVELGLWQAPSVRYPYVAPAAKDVKDRARELIAAVFAAGMNL